ncbi:hypothetical protein [Streptomyces millisiae]|uniref:Uncharacterized protein n=1 Tax=Streptomyces millisiae TaxID=3075542 RepID=A0ABU2LVE0_9ACTN|nr:hypothetical protein [Streptomyces sp. DSM 44918]MDT0321500.1 hypothetical protein [Streptomyces sp. DSM 44918]
MLRLEPHVDASVPPGMDFLFTPEEVRAARAAGADGRALHHGWKRITHLETVEVTGPAGSFALLHHPMSHAASRNRRPTTRVAQFMR